MTKTDWKDDSVHKTCIAIRKYQHALGYSENWMTEYVYNIVLLAKKSRSQKNKLALRFTTLAIIALL